MLGGISIWQLAILALIIILLFGTKKLRNIGGDVGNAVKGFKKAMSELTVAISTQLPQKGIAPGLSHGAFPAYDAIQGNSSGTLWPLRESESSSF